MRLSSLFIYTIIQFLLQFCFQISSTISVEALYYFVHLTSIALPILNFDIFLHSTLQYIQISHILYKLTNYLCSTWSGSRLFSLCAKTEFGV